MAAALADYASRALPGERRPSAESLHLTVAFLGGVEAHPDEVCRALGDAASRTAPFTLHPEGVRLMPRRRPRMLWAAFGPPQCFAELAGQVSRALASFGSHAPEGRPARPHVTLARLRGPAPAELPDPPSDIAPLEVRTVELWQSFLSPRGARYASLCDAPLGGAR